MTAWYGIKYSPHYGSTLEAGRRALPEAEEDLIRLAGDPLYPVIVRATALSLLNRYRSEGSARAFAQALWDEEPLIRRTAIEFLNVPDPRTWIGLIFPLLYDPVKAVRIQAAASLAGIPDERLSDELRSVFLGALGEYETAMKYSGDFASARHNLGNMYAALNKPEDAIANYRAALEIDRDFYPATMNLSVLLNRLGRNDEAERLLRDVLVSQPEFHEAEYSLGLLLAEKGDYADAAEYLEAAAGGMPERARVYYNLGLVLQRIDRDEEAEAALLRTLEIDPGEMDYLNAVADFYIKRERFREAKRIAERMIATHPSHPLGQNLLDLVNRELDARE
jgi:tetratricopeptide (TPR) repeat protein